MPMGNPVPPNLRPLASPANRLADQIPLLALWVMIGVDAYATLSMLGRPLALLWSAPLAAAIVIGHGKLFFSRRG